MLCSDGPNIGSLSNESKTAIAKAISWSLLELLNSDAHLKFACHSLRLSVLLEFLTVWLTPNQAIKAANTGPKTFAHESNKAITDVYELKHKATAYTPTRAVIIAE